MFKSVRTAESARSNFDWILGIARVRGNGHRGLVALTMLLVFQATIAFSQINSATLTGTVTDSSGAVIAGANVSVEQVETSTARSTSTNDAGFFNMPFLQPGSYTVSITKSGFESQTSHVTLQVNQIANLNFSLNVGQVSQSVTVSTSTVQLQTETSSLGTVIGAKDISNLPLNGRQFIQLLQLAPGTVPVSV